MKNSPDLFGGPQAAFGTASWLAKLVDQETEIYESMHVFCTKGTE